MSILLLSILKWQLPHVFIVYRNLEILFWIIEKPQIVNNATIQCMMILIMSIKVCIITKKIL